MEVSRWLVVTDILTDLHVGITVLHKYCRQQLVKVSLADQENPVAFLLFVSPLKGLPERFTSHIPRTRWTFYAKDGLTRIWGTWPGWPAMQDRKVAASLPVDQRFELAAFWASTEKSTLQLRPGLADCDTSREFTDFLNTFVGNNSGILPSSRAIYNGKALFYAYAPLSVPLLISTPLASVPLPKEDTLAPAVKDSDYDDMPGLLEPWEDSDLE